MNTVILKSQPAEYLLVTPKELAGLTVLSFFLVSSKQFAFRTAENALCCLLVLLFHSRILGNDMQLQDGNKLPGDSGHYSYWRMELKDFAAGVLQARQLFSQYKKIMPIYMCVYTYTDFFVFRINCTVTYDHSGL